MEFLKGKVRVYHGDSRTVLKEMGDASVDSAVTDPPYALVSIVKRFGKEGSAACKVPENGTGAYARASAGFMGKQWDTGETAFAAEFWAEVLRVLKPGGHVLAFSGTRTYHRLACAIEDAGFEIRDMTAWLYGSGFPKSHNHEIDGQKWGTALKPALEPIVLARKPLIGTVAANVLEHGTGALNIDGCRIEAEKQTGWGAAPAGGDTWNEENCGLGQRQDARPVNGRWPANVIHDGSDEVLAAFPETESGLFNGKRSADKFRSAYGAFKGTAEAENPTYGDSGSAARFFYTAKADSDDRIGSKHPTIKPVDLMRYLCRLITPPGGMVLDPFAGTGTTGEAAFYEGFNSTLIEREAEYIADIERRMALCLAGPKERERVIAAKKMEGKPIDAGPLFTGASA